MLISWIGTDKLKAIIAESIAPANPYNAENWRTDEYCDKKQETRYQIVLKYDLSKASETHS